MSEEGPLEENVSKTGRLIGLGVLLAIGLWAATVSLGLGLWQQRFPGAGLFPFIASAAMVVLSLIAIVRLSLSQEDASQPSATINRTQLLRVGVYLGTLLFYAFVLEFVGFAFATAITVVFILRFAERYSWHMTFGLTAGTVIGCHVLFNMLLDARLPAGMWESVLL